MLRRWRDHLSEKGIVSNMGIVSGVTLFRRKVNMATLTLLVGFGGMIAISFYLFAGCLRLGAAWAKITARRSHGFYSPHWSFNWRVVPYRFCL